VIAFLVQAESGDRRTSTPQTKSMSAPPIRILDQNGQPAVSGVPSATSTIVDVMVGPGFSFSPDTVNISVGDTVRWTWTVAATASPAALLACPIRNIVLQMI
jgi:plastocyanin